MTLNITKITDDYSTSPQISPSDMAEIANLGFKTIINNRPDLEGGAEQTTSTMLDEAAKQHGIQYVYIPVVPNQIQPDQVESFRQALSSSPKPVLGFCRTGNRASQMYARANTKTSAEHAGPFQALCAWTKRKCLITNFVRWIKTKHA
ncbi:MAG: TIGR01244 family protein [Methylophilaceae bacterium 17-44-8]|nr:MAG: TIGR01244 family protein [Methylophilales bacterium 28-44-11]OZA04664.1 MAG: TIGR01244 family protein [Methylophilaceae bacterium 17-44-8]